MDINDKGNTNQNMSISLRNYVISSASDKRCPHQIHIFYKIASVVRLYIELKSS